MIRVRNIFLSISHNENDLKKAVSSKLKISDKEIKKIKISKKSLDARKKDKIHYVYEVDIEIKNETKILKKNKSKDISKTPLEKYSFKAQKRNLNTRPVIVGSGPAGLFCAFLLSEAGYNPLIIERGEKIENRIKTVDTFWKKGILNENSNVQFGEGGAGTFSDGKLNTLVKDKFFRMKKVFEIFVSCGAPKEILYENNPHIGTDLLRKVIKNMRDKIISMGGEIRFNTCLTNLIIKDDKITAIEVNKNEIIKCENLILAIGHSARDTFEMLLSKKLIMSPKPFAVGIRIIHPQILIDKNQYGSDNYLKLKPANYKLTYMTESKRGVYSFCMCPGGYVVNASSEKERLVINGMSNYKRDSGYANSAIVVTVSPSDFGQDALSGVKFQRNLEEKAYLLGNGKIPVQFWQDFKNNNYNKHNIDPLAIKGSYKFSNLNDLFPNFITKSLKEGIENFEEKIKGFSSDDTLILGAEARTSSPVKFYRDDNLMSNIKGIYPCGEGAGYAGGITTSAMDGIKVFESIAKEK